MKRFHHADCNDHLHLFADNTFDLAIVDAEYGIGEDGRKKRPHAVKQKNGKVLKVKKAYQDEIWDNEPPGQSYFDQLFRVSKHQIIWGGGITCHFDKRIVPLVELFGIKSMAKMITLIVR